MEFGRWVCLYGEFHFVFLFPGPLSVFFPQIWITFLGALVTSLTPPLPFLPHHFFKSVKEHLGYNPTYFL